MEGFSEEKSYPTAGQLERTISQKVRALYRHRFGHQPSRVDCHLIGAKLVITLDDVITTVEKILTEREPSNLVDRVRLSLDKEIEMQILSLVEKITGEKVTRCIYHTAIDTEYAGGIFVFARSPQIRLSKTTGKRKTKVIPHKS